MSKTPNYPLEQMITIKTNRFDQAVKVLEEKKKLLEKEYEKLFDLTQKRDEVQMHKNEKLSQLREGMDTGAPTDKIDQMKVYFKTVEERLASENQKVTEQQKEVDLAQKQVDLATDELFQKKKDLEKLQLHKKEWEQEARYLLEKEEAVHHDDQGSSVHHLRKKERS